MAAPCRTCVCTPTFPRGSDVAGGPPPSESSPGAAGAEGEDSEVETLLGKLRDAEKVRVLSGTSFWEAGGVRRLDLPPLVLTDGPHGARGLDGAGFEGAALSPCETALAATFDEALIEEVGELLGLECARRGAHVLLGPDVNLQRMPNSGRHFECFSEDPHLSARAAVAYIRGVQRHVSACVKHFAANDQEESRFTSSSVIEERVLREVHLVPFEAAVREAGVDTIMCAYNRLNGTYCAESRWLLEEVLRREWGFRGVCVSDWFGNASTVPALEAGLNIEMPGIEPRNYGGWLLDAVRAGEVSRELLDERCRPVLRLLRRRAGGEPAPAETPEEHDARRRLLRRAASESLVLLRNEGGVLPLDAGRLRSLAVIGPNAAATCLQGGGSSRVRPRRCRTILEALREALEPGGVEVLHTEGTMPEYLPHLDNPLFHIVLCAGGCDAAGQAGSMRITRRVELLFKTLCWFSQKEWFRVTVMRILRRCGIGRPKPPPPPAPQAASPPRPPWRRRAAAVLLLAAVLLGPRGLLRSARGRRLAGLGLLALLGAWLGWPRVSRLLGRYAESRRLRQEASQRELAGRQERMLQLAEATATRADACVLVLGTSGYWETEGADQPHMQLPGRQDELVARVLTHARGPVAVVLNVGSPKSLPWADYAPAVLLATFGGEETAAAVADTLLGRSCPAGRLPTTWPRELLEVPPAASWFAAAASGELQKYAQGDIPYLEGLRFGYRGYGEGVPPPRFAFGHGLSYTRFEYGRLTVRLKVRCAEEHGPRASAHVEVCNAGLRAGAEVAQLYAAAGADGLRALCSFGRSPVLQPGESARFSFELDPRALGRAYDGQAQAWRQPQPGESVRVEVGASSADVRGRATLVLE